MQQRVIGRRMRAPRLGMVAALLAAILLATLSATAVGATNFFPVTVSTNHVTDDNNACATLGTGTCSLRDAIRYANLHTGATDLTTITVPGNIDPYRLTQLGSTDDNAAAGDLDIKANVTINGASASATIIDGKAGAPIPTASSRSLAASPPPSTT
jgi:CSLREA domain-containing protein